MGQPQSTQNVEKTEIINNKAGDAPNEHEIVSLITLIMLIIAMVCGVILIMYNKCRTKLLQQITKTARHELREVVTEAQK